MTKPWKVGDRVRFIKDYELPISPEEAPVPRVDKGAQGTVVRVNPDSIWVQPDGFSTSVTLWFPEAFPDPVAKTDSIERVGP
jgi:hypothetical protein